MAIRFTALSAVIGGLLVYATFGLLTKVTGPDTEMVFRGSTMLALPAQTRDLFRWAMLTDVFGFYLPFVAIGGGLWYAFREKAGAFGHMAAMALVFYVTMGVGGAVVQLATIEPLSQLYIAGGLDEKAIASISWATVVHVAQRGLWWSEAPAFFFWAMMIGRLLKQDGWGGSTLLRVTGSLAGVYFVCGFFRELDAFTNGIEMAVVGLLPLWMILFGWQLLHRSRK
ncbi:hypothetical protein [Paraburkholderia pallida]|uniref:DUF4386 domain-containing protein n=1 Tax=Paraburkholderia pallida TaxID=2547399 RepID=A0A4P7CVI4_9BURK|nr:hypothetical protein [Paraburkholderia pallida]QBQ99337.1 hypothetical protein E1956_19255 [Paraburkholderia pallida]